MFGTVVRLRLDKGFAFVTSEGRDYFLHITKFDGDFHSLRGGERVEFDGEPTARGYRR